jgi:hypothetical protein
MMVETNNFENIYMRVNYDNTFVTYGYFDRHHNYHGDYVIKS